MGGSEVAPIIGPSTRPRDNVTDVPTSSDGVNGKVADVADAFVLIE
jgi:hypothetical protein